MSTAQAASSPAPSGRQPAPPRSGPLAYWPSRDTLDRRAALRDLLRQRHDPGQARAAILGDEPYDQDLWRRLVTDMGAAAILAPEALDGLGLGYEDFAVTAGELGRVLYTGPFFGSAVLALGAAAGRDRDRTRRAGPGRSRRRPGPAGGRRADRGHAGLHGRPRPLDVRRRTRCPPRRPGPAGG